MYAALFAKTFGARLSLLHVFAGEMPSASGKARKNALNKNDAVDLENARLDMEAFAQLDFLRDVNPELKICSGHAADEICRIAIDSDTDLVVISTHGRTGLDRVLLGSVAEHVLRHAECPLLVAPNLPAIA
jgi:nucleotide-binding universal stress UspA family protein